MAVNRVRTARGSRNNACSTRLTAATGSVIRLPFTVRCARADRKPAVQNIAASEAWSYSRMWNPVGSCPK